MIHTTRQNPMLYSPFVLFVAYCYIASNRAPYSYSGTPASTTPGPTTPTRTTAAPSTAAPAMHPSPDYYLPCHAR